MRAIRDRVRRAFSVAGGFSLALLLVAATPIPGLAARAWSVQGRPQPADVIVVLGGGVIWPGRLACASLERIHRGVELYSQGFSPRIVVSGGHNRYLPELPSEAELMRRTAIMMGIPAEAVIAEPRSTRTYENGVAVADIMRQHGWRSALLVTDAIHMRRAKLVFDRLQVETRPAPTYVTGLALVTPGQGLAVMEDTGYEVAATVFYKLKGWI